MTTLPKWHLCQIPEQEKDMEEVEVGERELL